MLSMELSDIQARSILNFWKNLSKSIREKAGRNVYNMHVKATFKYSACQMSIVNEENFKIEGKTHWPQSVCVMHCTS